MELPSTKPDWGRKGVEQSLPDCFERVAAQRGPCQALGSETWQASYFELNGEANRIARALLAQGGRPGDRVALLFRHDTPLLAAALGVLKAGRVVVVLNPADPLDRLKVLLDHAGANLVFHDQPHDTLAQQVATGPRTVLDLGIPAESGLPDNLGLPIAPDAVAWLLYTSGSTGRPKAVAQTHRNILHNVHRLNRAMDLTPGDRAALLTAISGGQGVATFLVALLHGAPLFPFSLQEKGVVGLAGWLRDRHITFWSSSASIFRHFARTLHADERIPGLRLVRIGSEAATSEDFAAFCRHCPVGAEFLQTYSSSETGNVAQLALRHGSTVAPDPLPVGHAPPGMAFSLRDDLGREVGPGETGVIFITSRYLSPGYWDDPALTTARFHDVADQPGVRSFQSGDLGRATAEGSFVFVGRKDAQVKVRGYRVEPAEIEKALRQQLEVGQALVLGCDDPAGTRLLAFVVPQAGQKPDAAKLRAALAALLPPYMVPTGFVFVDQFPLTSHGKVDREKLKSLRPAVDETSFREPITATEAVLASIWAEELHAPLLGRDDHFFDRGGDSLRAAVVAARAHAALGVTLDLEFFARHPTLAAFAAAIDRRRTTSPEPGVPSPMPVPRIPPLPLSLSQERTWKFSQTPETSAAFDVHVTNVLRGPLDAAAFQATVEFVCRRHEAFWTTFTAEQGRPVQIVYPPGTIDWVYRDFSAGSDPRWRARDYIQEQMRIPFDLTCLPLFRFRLLRIDSQEHWLFRSNHHILSDTWSWHVFFRELNRAYEARLRKEPWPLPERAPMHIVDHAVWQRRAFGPDGTAYRADLAWWKAQLANAEPLWVPLRRREPDPDARPDEGVIELPLSALSAERLDRLARNESATPFAARLAVAAALLAEFSGQTDFVLGSYVTNRNRLELQNLFGFIVNLATLRLRFDRAMSFRRWLGEVRRTVNEALAHGELPYESLSEELRGMGVEPPEIRLIYDLGERMHGQRFDEAELAFHERFFPRMPWGFTLLFNQQGGRETLQLKFDARIYLPARVKAFAGRLPRLFDAVARAPDASAGWLLRLSRWPRPIAGIALAATALAGWFIARIITGRVHTGAGKASPPFRQLISVASSEKS